MKDFSDDAIRGVRMGWASIVNEPTAAVITELCDEILRLRSEAVVVAARRFRDASDALTAHRAERRDATTLPDKRWRFELIQLTEAVAAARIALHTAALG